MPAKDLRIEEQDLPLVAVLMPTFNGALYLHDQILSIKNQTDVVVRVYVNDDGSSDGTVEMIEGFVEAGLVYRVFKSNRIGSTQAFFRLLFEAQDEKYIAFSDQDDIWHPEKLQKSVKLLESEKSQMVFTSREHINAQGLTIGFSPRIRKSPGFRNALVENIAYGNTQLISEVACKTILRVGAVPVRHFDAWVYLIVSAEHKVTFLDLPLTKYRIHKNNQVGVRRKLDFRQAKKGLQNYYHQNRLFLQRNLANVDEVTISTIETHMRICDSRSLKCFLPRSNFIAYRQSRLDQFLIRLVLPFSSGRQK
jgi:glycosyltransferase involved in cell wall biosynthesis